ncbi:glycoside hydrolase family 18 protein [Terriglobus albidus]|uniref:glycoside hydrolase family 18 protein n=1 Tax=Terriglobus albidus TaxID=1592106 RepID=UPI0021DFB597|nr:glycosyl hydrolase family 18 protein [Terriglobus albidus]
MRTPGPFVAVILFVGALLPFAHAASAHRHKVTPHRPIVVGYFPQWQLYADTPYSVKALDQSGGARLLDQINYAQGFVKDGHCSVADPNADLKTIYSAENSVNGIADDPSSHFHGYFHQIQELKRKYPRLRLLISLEGRAADFAADAQPAVRKQFVRSCIDTFLHGHFADGIDVPGLFDGFDIDWESPHQEDAENFRELLREFREQMNAVRPGLRLSIAVGPSPRMLGGVDFRSIIPYLDQVGVMNYDYVGPWMQRSGFIAPLFRDPAHPGGSIDRGMNDYIAAGVPAHMLLMGMPFYGYGWKVPDGDNHGLFQAGPGIRGEDYPYHRIRNMKGKYILYRDRVSHAPWLYDGDTFFTFEDTASLSYKAAYAAKHGLGGVMIWELSGDTSDAELLHTVHRSLNRPPAWYTFPPEASPASAPQQAVRTRSTEAP